MKRVQKIVLPSTIAGYDLNQRVPILLPDRSCLWVPVTKNLKTGNIPTSWIGTTLHESKISCGLDTPFECKLLKGYRLPPEKGKKKGIFVGCYSQNGTPAIALAGISKALAKGKDYSLEYAMKESKRSARYFRWAAIGDPASLDLAYILKCNSEWLKIGLRPLAYTHFWKWRADLAGLFMASADNLLEADLAFDRGFRPTVILDRSFQGVAFKTPKGRKGVLCAAQRDQYYSNKPKREWVDCNSCGWCDATDKRFTFAVGFIDHSPGSKRPSKLNVLK